MVFIVSMYKDYQQTLFPIITESLTKSQTFSPDWSELDLNIRVELLNEEKIWFSRAVCGIT